MANTKWSRRELLKVGAGVALGAAVLETLSLRGLFDHRSLAPIDPTRATQLAERLFALDGLDQGGVLHLGQSTHLLSLGGVRVLFDPWFFDPAFGALRHPSPLPIAPQALGPIDVIVISHDHPDHADRRALDRLDKNALVIVGAKSLVPALRGLGYARVEYVPRDREVTLGALKVTGVQAVHDVPETGYVLTTGDQAIYFAGDTSADALFEAIAERWMLALAILPIDGTRVRGEARLVMDPYEAAEATALLKPKLVMSAHADALFGDPLVQHLLSERAAHPHQTFAREVKQRAPGVRCLTPKPGELVILS